MLDTNTPLGGYIEDLAGLKGQITDAEDLISKAYSVIGGAILGHGSGGVVLSRAA